MCFGSGPKAPEIKYVGPSKADIRRNEKALEDFRKSMTQQTQAFQDAINEQIFNAKEDTKALREELSIRTKAAEERANQATADAENELEDLKEQSAKDLANAVAEGAAFQGSSGIVSVGQSTPTNNGKTTKAITDKKKPNSSLKIKQNSLETAPGAGLSLGI